MDTGQKCQVLRIPDGDVTWRIVYAVEGDALVILAPAFVGSSQEVEVENGCMNEGSFVSLNLSA